MLNTFDIKVTDLDSINYTHRPYCVLCDASKIAAIDIPVLASKLLFDGELQLLQQRKKLCAKKEYIVSRFLIKTLISKHLKLPYNKIQLRFNHQEKKLQAIFNHQPIAMNISLAHSKGIVFFALSDKKTALGVDIEYQNFKRNIVNVAAEFFHPEEYKTLTQDDYLKFYQLWTLKESLAKVSGQSIFELLSQNTVLLLEKYQHSLGQYDNFQLAAIHSGELSPMPCNLLNLATILNNYHE